MIILENLMLAFAAIRANKMRSFLTMLGMIIGISSVITIVSLGDTMRGLMASEYENVGLGLGYIYIIAEDGYYTEREMFTLEEKERIQEAMGDDMLYTGFGSGARGDIKNGRRLETVYIQGLAENPSAYEDLAIIHGRMFTDTDISNKRDYVIIEDKTAISLFGQANVVGKTIKVPINQELQDMLITGVYTNTDSALMRLMSGGNSTSTVYVPEPLLITEYAWNSTLMFVASEDVNFADFQSRLISLVSRMKNINPQNINFISAQAEMSMVDTMLSSLSLIVGAIAAISLLVGGIGIMNIMLVSVTERTREIGIRKALGAQTSDIMVQFLVESAIISAAGGIIGTLLGLGLVSGGALLVGLSVVVKPYTILISVAFSAVVGIFFGLYPASKAAKADPVVALRYE